MSRTLLQKVWDAHGVRTLPTGQTQLFIGLHLVHEVTSPQAFAMLRDRGWQVQFPERTFATVDHIIPTLDQARPFADTLAEEMMSALERNAKEFGVPLWDLSSPRQGIVHVIGPELGLTQPGLTIACGDSHTSTHGAFGTVAFGIGTSQVRDVLASQCLAIDPLKVRRIDVTGSLARGVYAKDVILEIIRRLGVKGGVGFAYEYGGAVLDGMTMDERMTVCNMSIEGGARVGYVNPDQTTFDYLEGRPFAPAGEAFGRAKAWWASMASDADAAYDDRLEIDGAALAPVVTWGINPGQSIQVGERIPAPGDVEANDRPAVAEALAFMGFEGGAPIAGTKVDVAFIGSCTNSRLTDLREAAQVVATQRISPHVTGLVVPGSQAVAAAAEQEGLDEVFRAAGFEWRRAGCSMCLAMNPDKLEGQQVCASSSNRNFKGRQGSPTGRTLLMSPAMVAAAALAGEVTDVRQLAPAGSTVEVG
ncbi:MAG TPA: 3-isopropylmalate dehydratase large subunit [Acidobacteria bacterium]|jgi:3-isopropylmalate/(R)-2-methylmalate dehydratase large subunit|nr:3-isopropylmalate dehydratase large subunit [Acidobacteriota bacterium]MDP6371305.1 3-isopropylmalate dehydratase large subunit [Vicinamibacterales bacterium]HAK55064.1 3-isopropylmalate dehydratase large subunit [Acidobacteriota bacterium]|tara:strand:- start:4127 stop:5554 length:1428 start_codon:yes stop_codon:yes gene_type:complete